MSNIELLLCTANKEWAVVLSIPLSEVRRLSLRPLKWLTFVAFAICGAEGHLCVNRLGEHANYNATSTDPLAKEYYYFNQGQYHLVDHSTLNDRITSSTKTPRCSGFRKDLMARDGDCCTISELPAYCCDATHIIPASKDNLYLEQVVLGRSALYDADPDLAIDSPQNGMFLNKNLHAGFSVAKIAFLRTPNFAMGVEDVRYVGVGPVPLQRLTMQHVKEPEPAELRVHPEMDVVCRGNGAPPPSPLLLDYTYGAALYRHWGVGGKFKGLLDHYSAQHYGTALAQAGPQQLSPGTSKREHLSDLDWVPDRGSSSSYSRYSHDDELVEALDRLAELHYLLMGKTPEMMEAEAQRIADEEESRDRLASELKVQEWKTTLGC